VQHVNLLVEHGDQLIARSHHTCALMQHAPTRLSHQSQAVELHLLHSSDVRHRRLWTLDVYVAGCVAAHCCVCLSSVAP
jgi:hypothetical protein